MDHATVDMEGDMDTGEGCMVDPCMGDMVTVVQVMGWEEWELEWDFSEVNLSLFFFL